MELYYEFGDGVKQHYKKAVEFYKEAVAKGNASAQNSMGILYMKWKGIKISLKMSSELLLSILK